MVNCHFSHIHTIYAQYTQTSYTHSTQWNQIMCLQVQHKNRNKNITRPQVQKLQKKPQEQ